MSSSRPATRKEFKDYCLRRLGAPVIEINVDPDQIDDRVDDALQMFWDYHFDGTEKVYYKHQTTANNKPDAIYDVTITDGGIGYSNTDTISFTAIKGSAANGSIVTDGNGTITSVSFPNGSDFAVAPTVTVNTLTGSGAVLEAELGGFILLPENIIGAVRILDLGSSLSSRNMFSIQYQIALNDLYTLTSQSLVPYYMTYQHLQLMEQLLVGHQPIRYNRHRNRLYVDMNWARMNIGDFFIVEAYQVVDPDVWTDAWNDRWLKQYATALIKRQYALHVTKFVGMPMPSGLQFNGERWLDDAEKEIEKLEDELINSYSLPVTDMIG